MIQPTQWLVPCHIIPIVLNVPYCQSSLHTNHVKPQKKASVSGLASSIDLPISCSCSGDCLWNKRLPTAMWAPITLMFQQLCYRQYVCIWLLLESIQAWESFIHWRHQWYLIWSWYKDILCQNSVCLSCQKSTSMSSGKKNKHRKNVPYVSLNKDHCFVSSW